MRQSQTKNNILQQKKYFAAFGRFCHGRTFWDEEISTLRLVLKALKIFGRCYCCCSCWWRSRRSCCCCCCCCCSHCCRQRSRGLFVSFHLRGCLSFEGKKIKPKKFWFGFDSVLFCHHPGLSFLFWAFVTSLKYKAQVQTHNTSLTITNSMYRDGEKKGRF